jgi:hypothetical protein
MTCIHCGRQFKPTDPGVVTNIIQRGLFTAVACSSSHGQAVASWTSEQWLAYAGFVVGIAPPGGPGATLPEPNAPALRN